MAAAALAMFGAALAAGAQAQDQHAVDDVRQAFSKCRRIEAPEDRLRCYDRYEARISPPRFSGRLTFNTERFEVDRPTVLRFQSDGPIFVMYLKDDHDSVVQNLHLGGGGEGAYLIEKTGSYSLQINGSESWRVWVEPEIKAPE